MTWQRVFIIVTSAALIGMALGALFGYASGKMAPGFFQHMYPWAGDIEPVGLATFFGATAGVVLGGALGCFGMIMQAVSEGRRKRDA